MKLFKKALETFGSEFRIEGKTVYLEREIGSRTDIQFRYGYNVTTLEREVDTKNLTTYVKGYGDGIESEYTSPNAAIYGIIPAEPVRDDRITNMETLEKRMMERINDTPDLKIKVNVAFIDGEVEEGDYLYVIYEPMGGLDIEVRVMEVEEQYDFDLKPIQTNVTLASLNKDITDTIVQFNDTQKRVNKAITDGGSVRTSVLEGPIDTLKNMLLASGSYQTAEVREDQGYLLENNDETSPDFGALYIGPGIMAIANSKDSNGNWQWRSFGTGNGFTADEIIAGTMLADRIRGGKFRVGGFGNGDGVLELYDSDDNMILQLNNGGIELLNGAKLIGNGGVLSSFVFENSDWGEMGGWTHTVTQSKRQQLTFVVPSNFIITDAVMTAYIMPVLYEDLDGSNWTTVKNIKVFIGDGIDGYFNYVEAADTSGFVWRNERNITNDLWGVSSWSPSLTPSGSPEVKSRSGNLLNRISAGNSYTLQLFSDASGLPGVNTGLARIRVQITGYQQ